MVEKNKEYDFIFSRSQVKEILSYNFKIPVTYHYKILKEMEQCGLVKMLTQQRIKLLATDVKKPNIVFISDIIKEHENGKSQKKIGEELGLSQKTISLIINKKI